MSVERRFLKRDYFEPSDRMMVSLDTGKSRFEGDLIEFNSFGLSFSTNAPDSFPQGGSFKVTIRQADKVIGEFSKAVVVSKNGKKVSMMAVRETVERTVETRRLGRFNLSSSGVVPITLGNKVRYNDFIYLNVVEMSLDGGLAKCSVRNRTLVAKMKFLDAKVKLFDGEYNLGIQVKNIRTAEDKETLLIGFSFIEPTPTFTKACFAHILKFSKDMTPEAFQSMRSSVGDFKMVKDHLEYSLARGESEYGEVLKLRYVAYTRVGKVDSSKTWRDMADEFDSRSLILVAKFKGKIVASGRLTFAGPNDKFELDTSIELPKKFANDRPHVIEVSRLCADENFLGTNVIHGIFEWGFKYCVKSNVKWVISSTEAKLAKLYSRIGFTVSKQEFELVTLQGVPHYFMFASLNDVVEGKMNWLAWYVSFGQVLNYLDTANYRKMSRFTIIKKMMAKFILRMVNKIRS